MNTDDNWKKSHIFFRMYGVFVYLCRVLNHLTITIILLWQDLHNTI